jgi:hypothetical protein
MASTNETKHRVETIPVPAGSVAVAVPRNLIVAYRAARSRVARTALPHGVWSGDEHSRTLRDATFNLAEAAASEGK